MNLGQARRVSKNEVSTKKSKVKKQREKDDTSWFLFMRCGWHHLKAISSVHATCWICGSCLFLFAFWHLQNETGFRNAESKTCALSTLLSNCQPWLYTSDTWVLWQTIDSRPNCRPSESFSHWKRSRKLYFKSPPSDHYCSQSTYF